jgi:hypothetical protein
MEFGHGPAGEDQPQYTVGIDPDPDSDPDTEGNQEQTDRGGGGTGNSLPVLRSNKRIWTWWAMPTEYETSYY